jgi:hypothetical protein
MSADEILLSNALLTVLSPFITTTAFLLRKLGKAGRRAASSMRKGANTEILNFVNIHSA